MTKRKLGSSEPLGPHYDGTTMDNQQLHGTTRRNQPVVTAGETAQKFGDERQHQPIDLRCKFCDHVVFVPCSTRDKTRECWIFEKYIIPSTPVSTPSGSGK